MDDHPFTLLGRAQQRIQFSAVTIAQARASVVEQLAMPVEQLETR